MRLVLATANPHKAQELAALLDGFEVAPRPLEVPEVAETETTLAGNARLKARAVSSATGVGGFADDTGLEVDALDGAPGVYSARFAGPDATYGDNVAALLGALAAVGAHHDGDRRARFRTVGLVAFPDGTEVSAEGWVEGTIASGPRGLAGFGYDSVFVPTEGDGRTFAEMEATEKNAISHRARAFAALRVILGDR